MRQTLLLTGALSALFALSACGSKGPLYLPPPTPVATAPAAKPQVPADDNKPAMATQPTETKQEVKQ